MTTGGVGKKLAAVASLPATVSLSTAKSSAILSATAALESQQPQSAKEKLKDLSKDEAKEYWKNRLLVFTEKWIENKTVFFDDEVAIIKDQYPKALHHFLVLPRLKGLELVNLNRSHIPLLKKMKTEADKVVASLDPLHSFQFGFHTIPSMNQLHLHVCSTDFNAPALKNKKHYLSFHSPFFLHFNDVLEKIKTEGGMNFKPGFRETAEALLKGELVCHHCEQAFRGFPQLKAHLTKESIKPPPTCSCSSLSVSTTTTSLSSSNSATL